MSDNAIRYGFKWMRSLGGAAGSGIYEPRRVAVASGYQAAPGATNCHLWPGDPVTKIGDGTVTLAAAAGQIDGIIVGIGPYYNGVTMTFGDFLPGNTVYGTNLDRTSYVWIVDPGLQLFEAIVNDNTTCVQRSDYQAVVGENVNHILVPDATAFKATPKLNISGHANTNTLQWRIVDIPLRPEIDFTGLNVPLLVTANVVGQAPFQTTGVA